MIWTPDREAAALAFCRQFEGTPHCQRRLKPGVGADCVRFVVGAIQSAEILQPFQWPTYPQNIGFNQRVNWLARAFLDYTDGHSIAVDGWEPATGDVGIFKVGRTSNHVGLVVAGRFWHVTTHRAVHHCLIDTIRPGLQEIIRIDREGLKADPVNIIAK
jgi:hypothetical protein